MYAIVVGVLARPLEQLQIIDDDHADILLPFQAPCPGPQRGDRQARRVIDVQRQTLQLGGGTGEGAKLLLADPAHAQILGADPRLLREDACRELIRRHFQAEQRDGCAGGLGRLDPVLLVLQACACAAAKAMLVASALLPMPGRPATMIRSDL